ncbi:hypothetical protein HQ447_15640, partial [bacterium]|nr:hypothetical protein [bacterium]
PKVFARRYWNAAWQFPRLLWEERDQLFEIRQAGIPATGSEPAPELPQGQEPIAGDS